MEKEVLGRVCKETDQQTDSRDCQLRDGKVIAEHVDLLSPTRDEGKRRHDGRVVYRWMTNPHDMGESIQHN